MSFEESVIIPIDVYKRCGIEKNDEMEVLLSDTTIPTDRKMKLYAQAIRRKRLRTEKGKETIHTDDEPVSNHIELNFPVKDRPLIKSIVDFIDRHRAVVGWDEKDNSLVIDGRNIPDSDILDVLRYFTNNKLASTSDPSGVREFYQTLIDLGLPSEWIKRKPATRTSSRSKARRNKGQTTTTSSATTSSSTPKKWTSYS